MARARATKPEPFLDIPVPDGSVRSWLILGLDPSVSRTGYAVMKIDAPTGHAEWLAVGSLAPSDTSRPVWQRSLALGKALRLLLANLAEDHGGPGVSLILSLEMPTPMNDFLVTLNRIIHVMLYDQGDEANQTRMRLVDDTRELHVNASTLRSLMGLHKTGSKNKHENIACAYTYLDKETWPQLDSDACDAVLLAMMGRHTAMVYSGHVEKVPKAILRSLCDSTEIVKAPKAKKGVPDTLEAALRREKRTTRHLAGLLHRKEYWIQHRTEPVTVYHSSAASRKRDPLTFSI